MISPLVSIISPCYNVAPYIGRLFTSLISQSYKNLEIILVNDGSTDATGDVIRHYIPLLKAEGYNVLLIEQDNKGQSSALNAALKYVTGTYLMWPDADDWYTTDAIEKRVAFLEAHPQVALLRSNIEQIDNETGKSLGTLEEVSKPARKLTGLFHDLVHSKTWFAPIGYTLRVSILDQLIPGRDIYVNKGAGQNWQLMLPITFVSECWQEPSVSGFYLVRNSSHSHNNKKSYEEHILHVTSFERVLLETLSRIPGVPSHYAHWTIKKYSYERLCYAKFYKKRGDIWKFSKELLAVTPGLIQKGRIIIEALYHCIIKPIISR